HVLAVAMVGVVMGCIVCVSYGLLLGGSVSPGQYVKAAYFTTSLMLMLHGLDAGVRWLFLKTTGLAWASLPARIIAITVIGLPLVGAAMLTYRVKVHCPVDPGTLFQPAYTPVFLQSSGVTLAGWFVPAPMGSDDTILLRHDQGSSKAGLLA